MLSAKRKLQRRQRSPSTRRMPFASRTNWSRFPPIRQRQCSRSPCDAKSRYLGGVKCQKSFSFRRSRGATLRLLRLTMDGLPDRHIWGATPCIRIVRVRRLDLANLGPLAGKIRTFGEDPISFVEVSSSRRCCGAGAYDSGWCDIRAAHLGNHPSFAGRRQI